MTKARKIILALLSPLIFLATLVFLLYLPPVQRWAAPRVAAFASEKTGLDIRFDGLRIRPLLDLELQNLLVIDKPDTLVAVRRAVVDLDLRRLILARIAVEDIRLEEGKLNTAHLVESVLVRGGLQNLRLQADNINLKKKKVHVTLTRLEGADIDIHLRDTEEEDEESSGETPWKLEIDSVQILRSRVELAFPGDTMLVGGAMREALLTDGMVDLKHKIYGGTLRLEADSLHFDQTNRPYAENGLDANHLRLHDLSLAMRDFRYDQTKNLLDANVTHGAFTEQCGLRLEELRGILHMDSLRMTARNLTLQTPHSWFSGQADVEHTALRHGEDGQMTANLAASIGKTDYATIVGGTLKQQILDVVPEQPLLVALQCAGNIDRMTFDTCRLEMPETFQLEAAGYAEGFADSTTTRAKATWQLQTANLQAVRKLPGMGRFAIPPLQIAAETRVDGSVIDLDAQLCEGRGRALLAGKIDTHSMTYRANVQAKNLQLRHFLPHDSFGLLTATAQLQGRGTDPFNPASRMNANCHVQQLQYGTWDLDNLHAVANIDKGRGQVELNADNKLIALNACAAASTKRTLSDAKFDIDMRRIDMHALHLSPKPLVASMIFHVEGESNLRDSHVLTATASAIELETADTLLHPLDLQIALLMKPDTLSAHAESGDMDITATSGGGLQELLDRAQALTDEFNRQRHQYRLSQDTLKQFLPDINIHVSAGNNNPLVNYLRTQGYTMQRLYADLKADTLNGVNGFGHVFALNTGAVQLDTIQWRVMQEDSTGVSFDGRVRNGPKNKVVVFDSNLHADMTPSGAAISMRLLDAQGRKGMDLGLAAEMMENGTRFSMTPLNPIIAYRHFQINEDNFLTLTNDKRIETQLDLKADDGTGLKLYSIPGDALQDLTLSMNHFNVGELSRAIPYMPNLGGLMHGDIHYQQQDSTTLSVSTDMTVRDMTYNESPLGEINLNAVYLPTGENTHIVDAIVTQNGRKISTMNGMYTDGTPNNIEAQASLLKMPASLANAFLPNGIAALQGYLVGEVEVTGSTRRPMVNGVLTTDSLHLTSDPYNLRLRFPDDTIKIVQSAVNLETIRAYAAGKEPLTLDGTVDFSNLDAISLNMRVRADNYKLIDAPKTRQALAYGKAYVNLRGILRGTLDNLLMRGRLTILGKTDVTYVLRDSPLTVEDRLADLVTFTDFSEDTLKYEKVEVQRQQSMDMQLTIDVEQAAQVHCLLSETGQDYINLEGGGTLTMGYDNTHGMSLSGKYTIRRGEMNYTILPVVGSKHFTIGSNSYVEFDGDMMNPRLNISATERMKSSVSENGGRPRSVTFDVGLEISQTLRDMGLTFTLDAPQDMSVQNELAAMSQEDRGRVAVTMLATGMYVTDLTSTGGFSTSNTLNSYLQNEINNLVDLAQSTIDVNVGIENNTADGRNTTDYSFSFAKRFWGNRISIIIGGKVSTGDDARNTGQSVIDNVSLEYRLDDSATRYVKIYYDHNYESLLEGEITEMGAGVVFRRKTERLGELFLFRQRDKNIIPHGRK